MTEERSSAFGFLHSLAALFQGSERGEKRAGGKAAPDPGAKVATEFESALLELEKKLDAQKQEAEASGPQRARGLTSEERAAEIQKRTEAVHRTILEDVVAMHERLGTGVRGDELPRISSAVEALQDMVDAGRDSRALLPRARSAILQRLQKEAGEGSADDLVAGLRHAAIEWPDPMSHHPSATPEEIEAARQRRLRDVREVFLASDLHKTAERMLGIVRGWGSDYPARGSALWQESVLEAVAAGIRGKRVLEYVEALRQDRGEILSQVEALLGKDLEALHRSLQGGVSSLEQASRAAAGALRVVDEVVPQLAWERLRPRSAS